MNDSANLQTTRIASRETIAIDTIGLELVPTASEARLKPFSAGSHIDVHLPNGLVRQYSLSNDPEEGNRYVIAVKREAPGRGGSACVHDSLAVGDLLTVSAPRNNFALADDVRHARLVAGGIGITPIISMISVLERRGCSWELDYFARSAPHAAYVDSLARRRGGTVRHRFSDQVVSDFSPIVGAWQEGTQLYCCGPAGLMEGIRQGAISWPRGTVHFESFQAASQDHSQDQPFEVELARSGTTIQVPAGKSILEALRDSGYDAPSSCEEGICGSCETTLLHGEPDHRDCILSDDEIAANDRIMICVSRSRGGRLVLDL